MQKRPAVILLLMLCCALLTSSAAFAAEYSIITTAELKSKMDAGDDLLLINALSPIEHDDLHIKGSINIPSSMVKAGYPLLPESKDRLLVFYCKGPKCSKSGKAAQKALDLGYTNVMVYNEGLPAWAKSRYPTASNVDYPRFRVDRLTPKEVFEQKNSAILLDIRGPEVKKIGRIDGTVNIQLDDLRDEYTRLSKDKKIITLDHAGKQVNITAKFLKAKGYENLAVMDGGMLAWKRAGLPVVK